jgi:hypothetical protein
MHPEAPVCALELEYAPWNLSMHPGASICTLGLPCIPPLHQCMSLQPMCAPPLKLYAAPFTHACPWPYAPPQLVCLLPPMHASFHPCTPPSTHARPLLICPPPKFMCAFLNIYMLGFDFANKSHGNNNHCFLKVLLLEENPILSDVIMC